MNNTQGVEKTTSDEIQSNDVSHKQTWIKKYLQKNERIRLEELKGRINAICVELDNYNETDKTKEWHKRALSFKEYAKKAVKEKNLDIGWQHIREAKRELVHSYSRIRIITIARKKITVAKHLGLGAAEKLLNEIISSDIDTNGKPELEILQEALINSIQQIDKYYYKKYFKANIRTSTIKVLNLFFIVVAYLSIPVFLLVFNVIDKDINDLLELNNPELTFNSFITFTVILFGMLGAYFSSVTSLLNDPFGDDIHEKLVQESIGAYMRLLIGGVSAFILYIIILSGMLEILISDKILSPLNKYPENIYTLWVICFISGFSEKFVFDKLNRISNNMSSDKN